MMYEVKDAIAGMRSPFTFAGESEGRKADESLTPGQKMEEENGDSHLLVLFDARRAWAVELGACPEWLEDCGPGVLIISPSAATTARMSLSWMTTARRILKILKKRASMGWRR